MDVPLRLERGRSTVTHPHGGREIVTCWLCGTLRAGESCHV